MSKKETVSANYLDFIPNYQCEYEFTESGEVILFQINKGLFHKVAQVFFHKPKISKIHLDEMGQFIWPLIDGKRSIYDISILVKEHFGDKAEPLYNRLVQYMRNLEDYGFITLKKD